MSLSHDFLDCSSIAVKLVTKEIIKPVRPIIENLVENQLIVISDIN